MSAVVSTLAIFLRPVLLLSAVLSGVLSQLSYAVGNPTPQFPQLTVQKWAGAVLPLGGDSFRVPVRIQVENTGTEKLHELQIEDAVAVNIAPARLLGIEGLTISGAPLTPDRTFDGHTQVKLLASGQYLEPGKAAIVRFDVLFSADGNPGPFENRAAGWANDRSGQSVLDLCQNAAAAQTIQDDCQPALIILPITETPVIGLAKRMSEARPVGDGTLETRIYFVLENFGNKPLKNVQLEDDLHDAFAGTPFTVVGGFRSDGLQVDPTYDGAEQTSLLAAGSVLAARSQATVSVLVQFDPASTSGTLMNRANASAEGTTDESTAGDDPDPDGNGIPDEREVTVRDWRLPEPPAAAAVGLAHAVEPTEEQADGRFRTRFRYVAENLGEVTLEDLRIEDDLRDAFIGAASFEVLGDTLAGTKAINDTFDGSDDLNLLGEGVSLLPGEHLEVGVEVLFDPAGESSPFFNQAEISGRVTETTERVADLSTLGLNPDPDDDEDPVEADPTPIPFFRSAAALELIKSVAGVTSLAAGFKIDFHLQLRNIGPLDVRNVQVTDELRVAFPAPVTLIVNQPPSVSGGLTTGNDNFGPDDGLLLNGLETLVAGGSADIRFSVVVELNGAEGPFFNQATVTGSDPDGETVDDESDDEDSGDGGDTPTPIDLPANLSLTVLRDVNHNRTRDARDRPVVGWLAEILDQHGTTVSTLSTDPDGQVLLQDLPMGDYQVRVRNPDNSVVWAESRFQLQAGEDAALTQLVDPSGVVYASDSRMPLADVVLRLLEEDESPVDERCLLPDQQSQRTDSAGEYRFDLVLGHPGCPEDSNRVHLRVESVPEGYERAFSAQIRPEADPLILAACAAGTVLPCVIQAQNGPPAPGEEDGYYLSIDWAIGDEGVANNHLPVDPLGGAIPPAGGSLVVTHEADRARAVIGDLVSYTSTVENMGDGSVPAVSLTVEPPAGLQPLEDSLTVRGPGMDGIFDTVDDEVEQRPLPVEPPRSVSIGELPPGDMRRLDYVTRVTPAVAPGIRVSKTTGLISTQAADSASASLLIEADPLMAETTVIGKVFHDLNEDGIQDPGEPGIAGVRLVTLDGLVIETDSHGRYHVAAVDTGRMDRGTNFMIKLDALSLPQNRIALAGLRQVVRLTPGLMTRINFPVRTANKALETAPLEDRTDPFRFEPKLDILALDPITREEAGNGKKVRFAVFSNYYHHIRRYEIDFYDVSDPQFARQIPPYDIDAGRTLPTDLPDDVTRKLELEKHLQTLVKPLVTTEGLTVQVTDPQTDLFEEPIHLALGPDVTRIAYRLTAYGDCDPVLGEPFDRTGLRLLEVWEQPEGRMNDPGPMSQVRESWEIFGHSNLAIQNIPVTGHRNVSTRPPARMVRSETLPGVPPYLTEDIQGVPLPRGGRLSGEVIHATYGLQPGIEPAEEQRTLAIDEDETWAVFDHEGLEQSQRGYVNFDRERIVHGQKSGYVGYDDEARGVHRVLLTCGCSRMSAETIIDREANALSLRITNYGDLPEKPELSLHQGTRPIQFEDGQRSSLGSMPAQTTQEIFLGRFNADGINAAEGSESASWETAQVRFGVVDAWGNFPQFQLTRRVREGEYAADLQAFCENVTARPHTTTDNNLLASMIVTEAPVEAPPPAYFAMGLINITAGANNVSGNIEALADDDHFDEDVFVDGRIAGYVKGKILGRYLLTAQIDSTEDQLKNLGDNLQARDPRRVFRQLDPDRYYPVYGDDSTTFTDVDSQGAMYVRLDWDKSSALWGNFNTGLTDTEFSQYNRSLYGAKFDYRTQAANQFGEDTFALKVFGSEAQTASAHATYRATGGSLYYLPHRDIVQGSEKLWIEIRARDSEQVLHTEVLLPGRDYEVDDIQGRVILARPLAYLVRERANPIIRDGSLDGDRVYLQVDYEHLPPDFAAGDLTTGARAKWSGDRFSIGASSITDRRDGTDYELNGTDLSWRIGRESYVRAEYAHSEASQNDLQAASADGGLTFSDQQLEASEVGGNAWGVELMLDLADLNRTRLREAGASLEEVINDQVAGELLAWHKEKDAGFSAGRLGEADAYRDTGFSIEGRIREGYSLGGGAVRVQRGDRRQTIVRVQSELEFQCSQGGRCTELGVEGRYEDLESGIENPVPGRDGEALLIGARLGRELQHGAAVYGSVQTAVAADDRYEDNDRVLVGVNQRMTRRLALSLEGSDGDRGSALVGGIDYVAAGGAAVNLSGGIGSGATTQFGSRYTVADGREIYGTHTIDPDRTDGARNLTTLGQRSQLGSRTNVFTETTFGRDRNYADTAHVFGLDFELDEDWLLSANIQSSTLEADGLDVKRHGLSVGTSYRKEGKRLSSRFEYRRDEGDALDTRQYLTSTRFGLGGMNSEGRWIGKLNLAWTDNRTADVADGRFVELDVGYAFRPWRNDRWNALAKYTFLYDIGSNGQLGPNGASSGFSGRQLEEQSHVLSAELLHELGGGVELGGKVAGRFGKRRLLSDGDWYDSRLGFAAVRGRYRLPGAVAGSLDSHWEVLAEYRLLKDFEDGGTRHGLLTGLYRSMQNGQIKVGVGFNFTDFDGDLAGTDYKSGGWFVDIIAAY